MDMTGGGVPAAATRAVALKGPGAGAAAGAAASGVLGGVRAVRRDVEGGGGEVVVVFYDVRDSVTAKEDWGAAGVAVRFVEAGGGVQIHGTVVVFGLEAGGGVTREVEDIFLGFGRVREVRETPGKRGFRFVEYWDARDAENVVGKSGVEVGGRRVKIEASVRGRRQVREGDGAWEEDDDEEVEEAGRVAEDVGRVVVEEDEEEEDAGFLRGRLQGRRLNVGVVGDSVWEGSSASGSWGGCGFGASPEYEGISPPFSPVSMGVTPLVGREDEGGLMRELRLLQNAGSLGRGTSWGGFCGAFGSGIGMNVVGGRSPIALSSSLGAAVPTGVGRPRLEERGRARLGGMDMQIALPESVHHRSQIQQRQQLRQEEMSALQVQVQQERECEALKEKEREHHEKDREFEQRREVERSDRIFDGAHIQRSAPVETVRYQQQQQQGRYSGGSRGQIANGHGGHAAHGSHSTHSALSALSGHSGHSSQSGQSGHSGHSGHCGHNGYTGHSGHNVHNGHTGYNGHGGYSGLSGLSRHSVHSVHGGHSGHGGHNGHNGHSALNGHSHGHSGQGSNGSGSSAHSNHGGGNPRFSLVLDKVRSGGDTRTALMIRNIPNKYSSKMLSSALEETHRGHFNFLYLPIDFKNKCNVGYAFINFTAPRHIVAFYAEFHGRKWGKFNSDKVCEITYARIQGKQPLISHFSNSSLMNEDPKCRPIVFSADGTVEEFPVGMHVRTRRGPSARDAARVPDGNTSPASSPQGSPHQQPISPGRQRGRCN